MTKVTDHTADPDLVKLVTAMEPGGIERQQIADQHELTRACQLPRKGLVIRHMETSEEWTRTRATWDAFGIKIADKLGDDPLFVNVELPAGWSLKRTDSGYWTDLVDDKGRTRASMFYKSAFYDRDAHIGLRHRFQVRRDYAGDDYRTHIRCHVTDGGKVVYTSETIVTNGSIGAAVDAEQKAMLACGTWLEQQGYTDFRNVAAYWDVP